MKRPIVIIYIIALIGGLLFTGCSLYENTEYKVIEHPALNTDADPEDWDGHHPDIPQIGN